jgi:hypothetical protein
MTRPKFVNVDSLASLLRSLPRLHRLRRDFAFVELVVADFNIGTISSTFPSIKEAYMAFTRLVPRNLPSEEEWSEILPAAAALLVEIEKLNLSEPNLRLCDEALRWGKCGTAINPVTGECPFAELHI